MKRTARWLHSKYLPWCFWLIASAAVPFLSHFQDPATGWDMRVYRQAVHAIRSGSDPYAEGIAVQRAYHAERMLHPDPDATPPFTYVYSPITLPVLHVLSCLQPAWVIWLYWFVYAAGIVSIASVGLWQATSEERMIAACLVPGAFFFAGLVYMQVFLSGNLSYILYGAAFLSALAGWRRGQWGWFYIVVLLSSCFKAPLLSLLAVPLLTARRQWFSAGITAAAGCALFLVQPLLWPSQFHNYLTAVDLQFSFNRDFGASPAGLLGGLLFNEGRPYTAASTFFYALYAAFIFGILLYLAGQYFANRLSLKDWIPVMLLGVLLLNPRIKEYDVAAMTVPMGLILWRLCSRTGTGWLAALKFCVFLAVVNFVPLVDRSKTLELLCALMVALFIAGVWHLLNPVPMSGAVRSLQNSMCENGCGG